MVLVACFGQSLAGCGPLQQNTPDRLDFALPTLRFEVSSQSSQWRTAPANGLPNMVCAGPEATGTNCCAPPPPLPAFDCQQAPVACDPVDNFCALTFDVEDSLTVDLLADSPEVAAVDGRVFSSVSLLTLSVGVAGIDALPIRGANLYLGPVNLGGSLSPDASLLSPLGLAPGANQLAPNATAQQAFSRFARDYRTPFAALLSAHLVIPNGYFPTGTVTFTVSGRAEALY